MSLPIHGRRRSRAPTGVVLSLSEVQATLDAISQMTGGNAYSYTEWHKATSGSFDTWQALCNAEDKLRKYVMNELNRMNQR